MDNLEEVTMKMTTKKTDSFDETIALIGDYVANPPAFSTLAMDTARACLADTIGCGLLALSYPACTKLIGPVIEGTVVPKGSRVPGTSYVLDPIRAAFSIGTTIRWLDYNDTWLAKEWGHPSDNLGALLATADFLSQRGSYTVANLLKDMIQGHEIQGGLALGNAMNRIGFDHVFFVKIASCAVSCKMLSGSLQEIQQAISQCWIDTGPLRTYRHFPNTGSRKSWAAGDATRRGLELAWITLQKEMGYTTALSAKEWGFCDVLYKGEPITWERPLSDYVMENVLFKISFPAEFHAQTAVEAAFVLHPEFIQKPVKKIVIETHESAIRIIDKKGPLQNPADRDHCLQYMVAVGLLEGELTADHYEDTYAQNPEIDAIREKMEVVENPLFSKEYLNPEKRSIANAITLYFADGTESERVEVCYPIGHRRRRKEGLPLLYQKFQKNVAGCLGEQRSSELVNLFQDKERLEKMEVAELVSALIPTLE